MVIWGAYGVIMLEKNVNDLIKEIFKFVKSRYETWKMETSAFSFIYMSELTVRYKKVNEAKGSSYIKSSEWLKCKNATVNPKIIDNRSFQYSFMLMQHYKEMRNHLEGVSNIKQEWIFHL